MREQRRALKNAGALLMNENIGRLQRELVVDCIAVRRDGPLPTRGGGPGRAIVRPGLLGTEKDRDAGAPGRRDEALGRRDGAVGVDAAGHGVALIELMG